MQQEQLIPAEEFCMHFNIGVTFLQSLDEFGLIRMTKKEQAFYLDPNDLYDIEKMIRFHFDLNINLEGIDVITQLLKRMEQMQQDMLQLRNQLRMFES